MTTERFIKSSLRRLDNLRYIFSEEKYEKVDFFFRNLDRRLRIRADGLFRLFIRARRAGAGRRPFETRATLPAEQRRRRVYGAVQARRRRKAVQTGARRRSELRRRAHQPGAGLLLFKRFARGGRRGARRRQTRSRQPLRALRAGGGAPE